MIRRHTFLAAVLVLSALVTAPLAAQGPGAERLRTQVVERLLQNMQSQAGLTDEQFDRVRQNIRSHFEQRQAMRRQQRDLWQSIESELRPGVAADEARLDELLGRLTALLAEDAARVQRQQEELAEFLSPVQRAVVFRNLTRLEAQVEEMVRRRMGRPGMGPVDQR